jgi:hypothetical protein
MGEARSKHAARRADRYGWNFGDGDPPPEVHAAIRAEAARVKAESLERTREGMSGPVGPKPDSLAALHADRRRASLEAISGAVRAILAEGGRTTIETVSRRCGLPYGRVAFYRRDLVKAGVWPK